MKEHFAFLMPDKQNMPVDIFIPLAMLDGAKDGDHAVARITEWSSKKKNPIGEIISVLTDESEERDRHAGHPDGRRLPPPLPR